MKLITFTSFKGGAGKSTALMATTGSFTDEGKRVALFEADRNQPLAKWRTKAKELGTWDEHCQVFPAIELRDFENSFEAAEEAGFDIAITDTQGGGSELNNTIIVSSDVVVIPTALTQLDIEAALDTYEYVIELFGRQEGYDHEAPAALLIQRMPTGRLSIAERAHLALLDSLPRFETMMPTRNAYADIAANGMLHLYQKLLAETPAKRITANHIKTAVLDAAKLSQDIWSVVEGDS